MMRSEPRTAVFRGNRIEQPPRRRRIAPVLRDARMWIGAALLGGILIVVIFGGGSL